MTWTTYNPDGGLIEARYGIKDNILYIEIEGANNFIDIIKSILFCFLPRVKKFGFKYHRYWYNISYKLLIEMQDNFHTGDVSKIIINGHSMGAAVGSYLASHLLYFKGIFGRQYEIRMQGYGGPKTGFEYRNYYNKNDIIRFMPFWYKKQNNICTGKKYSIFKAHNWKNYNWRI